MDCDGAPGDCFHTEILAARGKKPTGTLCLPGRFGQGTPRQQRRTGTTAQLLVPDIKSIPIRISLVSGLGAGYFDGMIAEVKVYNTALSDKQITAHCADRASVFQVVPRQTTQEQPPKLGKVEGARKQTRKLEQAERHTVLKNGGYFPRLDSVKERDVSGSCAQRRAPRRRWRTSCPHHLPQWRQGLVGSPHDRENAA